MWETEGQSVARISRRLQGDINNEQPSFRGARSANPESRDCLHPALHIEIPGSMLRIAPE